MRTSIHEAAVLRATDCDSVTQKKMIPTLRELRLRRQKEISSRGNMPKAGKIPGTRTGVQAYINRIDHLYDVGSRSIKDAMQ